MTNYQHGLLAKLRKGGKFRSELGNWYKQNRRLREETRAALEATGELARITVVGHNGTWFYICHRTKVAEVAKGASLREIKNIEPT